MCIVSEEQHFFGAPPLWQAWWTAAGHRRDAPSPLTWMRILDGYIEKVN